jgi:hypothetical protein
MKRPLLAVGIALLAIAVIGGVYTGFFISKPSYVCSDNSIVSNPSLCPQTTVQTTQQSTPTSQIKTIEVSQLTNFVATTIHKYFPSSNGAFFRFGKTLEEQREAGEYCWTGFKKPCTSWIYPSESGTVGDIFAKVLDFGIGDSPSVDEALSTHKDFWNVQYPGTKKRTLSNGDIIFQSTAPQSSGDSYFIAVRVPCGNQYWVDVDTSSMEPISEGPFLAIANEILGFCK